MTESSYALSIRSNGDATLHIRGGDYDEFYTNALVALGPRLDNILAGFGGGRVSEQQAVQNVADAGMLPPQQEAPPPAPPQAPSAPPPPPPPPATPQAPAQPQAQPQQDVPHCDHGARQFRTGTNRNGNPYRAYFCPLPKERRDEQCKPLFLDD